ncbi:phosphoserine phosphatase SerB [Aureimonas endophytica]|uniref:Phosphoserine phosphatase n=1 Tax=Aureimonas endophytica TaxID=2027858 RepID=A0A916ZE52_9HYPH|nr:phosphoserine phosphatase SerB [Aureimonas endophytica]GGD91974.1 phosphoserine phosphatase SerB [Aureimonas endophytica]
MHVATLISARAARRLSPDLAREAARRLGAAEPDWLEAEVACDLALPATPAAGTVAELQAFLAAAAIDCVVQEAATRRKRILIADMDSTMIGQECIDELADIIGIKTAVAAITARAMNGEIAFEPALRERVALLKDLPEATIGRVIEERITLAEGGRTLVQTMRAEGAVTALVSGGFTAFTSAVAAMLGFHETRANLLLVENGRLTGRVADPILGKEAKVAALEEIAAANGLTPGDAIAVGDGANDLGMIQRAGTGVAIHAKPAVASAAPHRIDHGDLTALLFLQGYRAVEFRN